MTFHQSACVEGEQLNVTSYRRSIVRLSYIGSLSEYPNYSALGENALNLVQY